MFNFKKTLVLAMVSFLVISAAWLMFDNQSSKAAKINSESLVAASCPAPQVWDQIMNECTCRVCENPGSCGSMGACNCGGCLNKPGYGLGYACSVSTGIGHCLKGFPAIIKLAPVR